jgi:dTDP-4-dehydrorhamnose 3,5-epimerase-like enzyme
VDEGCGGGQRIALPEVLLIEPKVFADERGFFLETWN